VSAKIKAVRDDLIFRIYITDSLYHLAQGGRLKTRYWDLMCQVNGNTVNVSTDSADDIIANLVNKHGLKVVA